MRQGLSQPSCSQDQLSYIEDKMTNTQNQIDEMIYWNKVVKRTKHQLEKDKEKYRNRVDKFAQKLKEQIENTSEDDELDQLITQQNDQAEQIIWATLAVRRWIQLWLKNLE